MIFDQISKSEWKGFLVLNFSILCRRNVKFHQIFLSSLDRRLRFSDELFSTYVFFYLYRHFRRLHSAPVTVLALYHILRLDWSNEKKKMIKLNESSEEKRLREEIKWKFQRSIECFQGRGKINEAEKSLSIWSLICCVRCMENPKKKKPLRCNVKVFRCFYSKLSPVHLVDSFRRDC